MSPSNSRRGRAPRYHSPLREQQAAATCRLILDTAVELFLAHGYAATSIDAIAKAAGVGRSTVFSAAGAKPWLLKNAYDRAVVGDDEPVPLLARPQSIALLDIADPATMIDTYAHLISQTAQRVSGIYDVVQAATGCDRGVDRALDADPRRAPCRSPRFYRSPRSAQPAAPRSEHRTRRRHRVDLQRSGAAQLAGRKACLATGPLLLVAGRKPAPPAPRVTTR